MRKLAKKQKEKVFSGIRSVLGIAIGLILAIPFFWMIICAFQESSTDVYSFPPVIPDFSNFKNFIYYLTSPEVDFLNQLWNTLILVVANMVIGIGSSILIAYGFARFRAKGKKVCFTILLSTMMLPWVVTMVPAYVLFAEAGLVGTLWPLILPSIGGSAYNIFLLQQFFRSIPREFDDAAKIDGCNSLQILTKILLPNCGPIIATMVIFSFIGIWSDYVGPSIYILDQEKYTLALGLQFLKTSNFIAPPWHRLLAGCVLYALPMVIVYISCQKAFVRGAVDSAIK